MSAGHGFATQFQRNIHFCFFLAKKKNQNRTQLLKMYFWIHSNVKLKNIITVGAVQLIRKCKLSINGLVLY